MTNTAALDVLNLVCRQKLHGWRDGETDLALAMRERGSTIEEISREIGRNEREVTEVLGMQVEGTVKDLSYEAALEEIGNLLKKGISQAAMAEQLNADGYRTKRGKPWTYPTVSLAIKKLRVPKTEPPPDESEKKERPEPERPSKKYDRSAWLGRSPLSPALIRRMSRRRESIARRLEVERRKLASGVEVVECLKREIEGLDEVIGTAERFVTPKGEEE